MPRDLIHAPGHDRNRSLGWLGAAWMEHFTIHGPGDVVGEPVELDDELVELTVDCYATDAYARRLYDSAFISRAKGRDKSGHAGRHVLFEAFGPCRGTGQIAKGGEVYRWRDFAYEYQPGEPIGRTVTHPVIRCLATEETQAGNTYDNVYFNLTEGPLADGLPAGAAGITRTNLPHGGEIIPSSAANSSKDGGKETFVVFDETHLYITRELRQMYSTVRRNLAKRKAAEPWSLETSTMYLPGQGSVAEDTHALAVSIREGKTKRARLLFDHREAPPGVDLADEEQLLAALREVYGPFADVMDLRRIVDEIWDPRNSPADSRRYYLNQATSAADSWLSKPEWEQCRDLTKVVEPGQAITLGFDGSRGRIRGVADATALIGCRVSDGFLFEIKVWEQPDGVAGQDWKVQPSEVDMVVREVFARHRVVAFYADPAKWESTVAEWEARWGAGLAVKVRNDNPIEWWMTGGRSKIIERALELFHNAVLEKDLSHDGSSHLHEHVINARRRVNRGTLQIGKEYPDSPRKIDAAVAAVLAYQARIDAVAAGVTDVQPRSAPRRLR